MKNIFILVSIISLTLLFAGCGKQKTADVCLINSGSFACGSTSGTIDHSDLSGAMNTVLLALKNNDLLTLSTFVGPQGLRFSPYEHVNITTDIVLSTDEVYNGLALSRSFTWGAYDGSGEPIDLGIGQYFEKFVYDADFVTAPEIYHNKKFERGNVINNIFDVYSGNYIVEYHFSQIDPQYEGMDRKSLYLIFENTNGQRYLIGIVHGQRTI
ncbi:MAG: hypothetical protein WC606_03025 [Candidatus Absconditabacterales bacterium]